jgi:hypothetical protein
MIDVWSVSCAAVSPADNTACSVGVDKQDFNWLVLYAGRRAASKGFVDCRESEKNIPSFLSEKCLVRLRCRKVVKIRLV